MIGSLRMFRWTLHLSSGPTTSRMAAVAAGDDVYAFGAGCTANKDQIGVHIFNTVSLRWRELTTARGECHLEVPCRRWGHTAVMIDYIVYIWGGGYNHNYNNKYCNILYAFDVDTHRWFKPKVSGAVPVARRNHSACSLGDPGIFFQRGRRKRSLGLP